MTRNVHIHALSRPPLWVIIALLLISRPLAAQEPIRVAKVIDGDTIVLVGGDTVRYIGIDTPEVRRREGQHWVYDPQPFALAASDENRRLVAGEWVRLEGDRQQHDRYGRRLAYVYLGDKMINEHLVRRGLARAKAYPPNLRHQGRLKAAQAEARHAGRGIWKQTQR